MTFYFFLRKETNITDPPCIRNNTLHLYSKKLWSILLDGYTFEDLVSRYIRNVPQIFSSKAICKEKQE